MEQFDIFKLKFIENKLIKFNLFSHVNLEVLQFKEMWKRKNI